MPRTKKQQLGQSREFRTVAEIMADIEQEIAAVKDGSLTDAKARTVARFRQLQLKGVDQYLQVARLQVRLGLRPGSSIQEIRQRLGMPEQLEAGSGPVQ